MRTADLYDELRRRRDATEAARSRAAFIADATALLSRSLDYEKTLAAVAKLAVPDVADWCAVDLVDPDGLLQRVAVAHADPAKVELAWDLHRRYPPDPDAPGGVHDVIRTGEPAMMAKIPSGTGSVPRTRRRACTNSDGTRFDVLHVCATGMHERHRGRD